MIKIVGTGSYLPKKILTNKELEEMVDTTDQWIKQRTGISERRIADDNESTSDLAVNASLKALEMANMKPQDLQLIILGTSTADYSIPATAPIVQNKLGCNRTPAFDLNSVCTSFTFAMINAYGLLSSGLYENCLVIGADTYSRILNWRDRNSCIIFGDGAGAFVLKRDDKKNKILSHIFGVDGAGSDLIRIPLGGAVNPVHYVEDLQNKYNTDDLFFQMDGKKVYEFTISIVPDAAMKLLQLANLSNNDIDWVVLHQANIRIIDTVSKYLQIPKEKFLVNIERVGNTSSASIPIVVDEAFRAGKIKDGDKVMMFGFGGGLSWGGFIIEW